MNDNGYIRFVTVIVTYGNYSRWNGLKKTIESVINGGTSKIILVNNGCKYNLKKEMLNNHFDVDIEMKEFEKNLGSLIGFKSGLEKAIKDCKVNLDDYILVLDDDVQLDSNFLESFKAINGKYPSKCVWSLYRQGRDKSETASFDRNKNYYENSIAGFSIFKRKKNTLTPRNGQLAHPFFIPWAGTFLKKNDLLNIPLPRDDFFVYEDDAEFSLNVKESGYDICRSYNLILKESSKSWFENGNNAQSGYELYYSGKANPGRFLYKVRNNTFLIKNRLLVKKTEFYINITVFVIAGFVKYGLFKQGSIKRLKDLCDAISMGLHGHLGKNEKWKL